MGTSFINFGPIKKQAIFGEQIIPDFGQIPLRPLLGKQNIQVSEKDYSMRKKDDKVGIKTGHGYKIKGMGKK